MIVVSYAAHLLMGFWCKIQNKCKSTSYLDGCDKYTIKGDLLAGLEIMKQIQKDFGGISNQRG